MVVAVAEIAAEQELPISEAGIGSMQSCCTDFHTQMGLKVFDGHVRLRQVRYEGNRNSPEE